jgi:hypothetical protein
VIRRLWERLTGTPWTTTRSMAAEYGPPPGALFAAELAEYSDAELVKFGDEVVARLRLERGQW